MATVKDLNIGEVVYLKDTPEAKAYLGSYAGSDAKIVNINTTITITVEGHDGRKFMCPVDYIMTMDEVYYGLGSETFKRVFNKPAGTPPPIPKKATEDVCKHPNKYENCMPVSGDKFWVCPDCKQEVSENSNPFEYDDWDFWG